MFRLHYCFNLHLNFPTVYYIGKQNFVDELLLISHNNIAFSHSETTNQQKFYFSTPKIVDGYIHTYIGRVSEIIFTCSYDRYSSIYACWQLLGAHRPRPMYSQQPPQAYLDPTVTDLHLDTTLIYRIQVHCTFIVLCIFITRVLNKK